MSERSRLLADSILPAPSSAKSPVPWMARPPLSTQCCYTLCFDQVSVLTIIHGKEAPLTRAEKSIDPRERARVFRKLFVSTGF